MLNESLLFVFWTSRFLAGHCFLALLQIVLQLNKKGQSITLPLLPVLAVFICRARLAAHVWK
jgi:hypothetical protein